MFWQRNFARCKGGYLFTTSGMDGLMAEGGLNHMIRADDHQMGNKTKKCNLANESKAMVEADKKCKKAYGECRK